MNLKLRTPWDVVSEYGHSSLRLLKIAYDNETEIASNAAKMEAFAVGADGYVALVERNEFLGTDMFRILTATIVMFQTMLDTAMADSLRLDSRLSEINAGDSFKDQWEKALTKFGKDTTSLNAYNNDIHKRFWMPLTHLTRNGLGGFNNLTAALVHQGLAQGWDAYTLLAQGIGKPREKDSWATTCALHGLPESM